MFSFMGGRRKTAAFTCGCVLCGGTVSLLLVLTRGPAFAKGGLETGLRLIGAAESSRRIEFGRF